MANAIPSYDEFKSTGNYQSLGLDALQSQLSQYNVSDAELRRQAEALYTPTYQTEVEAIDQSAQQQTLAYQNQLGGVSNAYGKQRQSANEQFDQSASNLNSSLLKRGLGRSSLVSTQGTYLENQRAKSLDAIGSDEANAINSINQQITLLASQSAASKRTMASNYAQQIEARVSDLKNANQTAATNMALQIASLQQSAYQAYSEYLLNNRAQTLAEDQFAWQKKKSGSGGGGGSYTGNPATPPTDPALDSDGWLAALLAGSNPVQKPTVQKYTPSAAQTSKISSMLNNVKAKTSTAKNNTLTTSGNKKKLVY